MLPGADQDWRPLNPEVMCVGLGLVELARLHPGDPDLAAAGWVVIVEAEKFEPDMLELEWAWDRAKGALVEMLDSGRAGVLDMMVHEKMERFSW